MIRPLNVLVFLVLLAGCSFAQTPTPTPTPSPSPDPAVSDIEDDDADEKDVIVFAGDDEDSEQDSEDDDDQGKKKRGSWVFAPIPIKSPTFGAGVILGGGYIFKLKMADKTSPPSSVGLATAFTNNGTRGLALGASLNFAENKYRTTVAFGKGRAVYRYYGIGQTPGAEDRSVMLRQNGTVFFGEFLRNTWKDVFIGARYQYRKLSTTIEDIQLPGGIEIPPIDLETTSASLGFKVMRDLRDNSFYPTKGSLWTVTGDFFSEALGSRRNYRVFKASYNGYKTIGQGQVLAYRGMACSVSDETPFFDLCYFGGSDLRGYSTGQFQNRRMFATQVEYRRELPWRFGLVGFGGVGGVARRLNEFRFDELLPAVGAGLRFKLEKTNHINYRIDLGYGRAGYTLSLSVTEAF